MKSYLNTYFEMEFNLDGVEVEYLNEYQRSFWRGVIGILVSILVVTLSVIGLWLYY